MLHVHRPVREVLMGRGIQDPQAFLQPSKWADLPEPTSVEGVAEAIPLLLSAVMAGSKITIFGDYDCDGALSSAILEATLLRLGAIVSVYLPHRDEGYGLSESAVHRFSRSGTKCLITIDNGINATGPVHLAQRLGMSVLVIDHHQIETRALTPVVWSDQFCAAGLAYMVSSALLLKSNLPAELRNEFLASLSRLAAIASIADCVPLTGATRTLTRLGLAELSRTTHAGLRKLMDLGGIMRTQIPSAEQIAFRIGPRLNAAGRVGHPDEVLQMLKARSPEEQSRLALELDRLNLTRRRLERQACRQWTVGRRVSTRAHSRTRTMLNGLRHTPLARKGSGGTLPAVSGRFPPSTSTTPNNPWLTF
jgi:single-stranded-DNA-specific exonuclease